MCSLCSFEHKNVFINSSKIECLMKDDSVHLTLRISGTLSEEIDKQMVILGYVRKTDYVRAAIKEKIERDKYQFESGSQYYVGEVPAKYGERPIPFDTELMRALISNKDIQKVICDFVEKYLKEKE